MRGGGGRNRCMILSQDPVKEDSVLGPGPLSKTTESPGHHLLCTALMIAGSTGALYCTMLRTNLPKEDSVLGSWPPGRDAAEDELRTYAGEQCVWRSDKCDRVRSAAEALSSYDGSKQPHTREPGASKRKVATGTMPPPLPPLSS